jgi:Gly-Xaa carboxypeptidase
MASNCKSKGGTDLISTIVFSFGFDEEIGGPRGAAELSKVVLNRYGPDGVAIIVDEGFTGVDPDPSSPTGQLFARVGLGEKGCLTVLLSLSTPGGHSSSPPPHTGIGIMSEIVVAMEASPQMPKLLRGNPLLTYLECVSEFGGMDEDVQAQLKDKRRWGELAGRLARDKSLRAFMSTTQVYRNSNIVSRTGLIRTGGRYYARWNQVQRAAGDCDVDDQLPYRLFRDV